MADALNAAAMPMLDIVAHVERELARGASTITLDVLDPDAGAGLHAGERVEVGGRSFIHRSLRVWVDLAERFRLRLRTPRTIEVSRVHLTFDKLAVGDSSSPDDANIEASERYGTGSTFARVRKLEDPTFVIDLTEALERVVARLTDVRAHVGTAVRADPNASATSDVRVRADANDIPARASAPDLAAGALTRDAAPLRVLDLGVNTGDELALILARIPPLRDATFVGVDHSASALATARERFAAHPNISFVEADAATLGAHELGRFDLVLSIGLLQSGALDDRELLRTIVQDHLTPRGAVILGMPNCRYVDGEVEYGARIVNITQPELGLLVKDVAFYRKYLQQHHRKVFVTGKHYLFVTAIAE